MSAWRPVLQPILCMAAAIALIDGSRACRKVSRSSSAARRQHLGNAIWVKFGTSALGVRNWIALRTAGRPSSRRNNRSAIRPRIAAQACGFRKPPSPGSLRVNPPPERRHRPRPVCGWRSRKVCPPDSPGGESGWPTDRGRFLCRKARKNSACLPPVKRWYRHRQIQIHRLPPKGPGALPGGGTLISIFHSDLKKP